MINVFDLNLTKINRSTIFITAYFNHSSLLYIFSAEFYDVVIFPTLLIICNDIQYVIYLQ